MYKEADTDMGDFWLSFWEMTDPLVQNIDACHAKHLNEYTSSTCIMMPELMAYDNCGYGRWLPDYWTMLFLLSDEQMAFFSDHLTQSITGQPYTYQPLDLWVETTMNLNSKLDNDSSSFCRMRNNCFRLQEMQTMWQE